MATWVVTNGDNTNVSGTDNCDGSVTPDVNTAGPTNTGCSYSQTWTATYTDACGNAAIPVSVTYTWTQDFEVPVISTTATSGSLGAIQRLLHQLSPGPIIVKEQLLRL
ncbi:MAG: hypothetical protein IPF68_20360 [Bacteroidales bacterium]|nr:hypothetical protein [Bacteroidales bacterium]